MLHFVVILARSPALGDAPAGKSGRPVPESLAPVAVGAAGRPARDIAVIFLQNPHNLPLANLKGQDDSES